MGDYNRVEEIGVRDKTMDPKHNPELLRMLLEIWHPGYYVNK